MYTTITPKLLLLFFMLFAENKTATLTIQLKISNRQLQEVMVTSTKNKFAKKETVYVARMPLKNLENPQLLEHIEAIKGPSGAEDEFGYSQYNHILFGLSAEKQEK